MNTGANTCWYCKKAKQSGRICIQCFPSSTEENTKHCLKPACSLSNDETECEFNGWFDELTVLDESFDDSVTRVFLC
jgi:hypothetical protein